MSENKAIPYVLGLLARRDYFSWELKAKAAAKFGEEAAEEALIYVNKHGFQDDEKTCDAFIISKLRSGYGAYYISSKLYEKGCNITAEDVLAMAEKIGFNMEEKIKELAKNYLNKKNIDDPFKAKGKCMNYLIKRGYQGSLCREILNLF